MSEGLLYLDSSAIVKLVRRERETEALLELLTEWPERVSSGLARVEVSRAVKRAGDEPGSIQRAGKVIDRLGLIRIDTEVLGIAAGVSPGELRTLDAIHLATALSLGEDLGALVVYDERLARAAAANGLTALSPGYTPMGRDIITIWPFSFWRDSRRHACHATLYLAAFCTPSAVPPREHRSGPVTCVIRVIRRLPRTGSTALPRCAGHRRCSG